MYCSVCFSSSSETQITTLPCTCISCSDCLTSWIATQALELHYQTHEKIPCMNAICKAPFKVDDVFSQLNQQQQDMLNDILHDVYLKKTEDIRKCPDKDCSYAGVIDLSIPCKDNLECSMCGTQWRERVHYDTTEKLKEFLTNRQSKTNEVLTEVWEETFTRRCPKCNVRIQKNGGCNHMTCKKCQHEFCWLCNQNHKGHSRKYCRFSALAKVMLIWMTAFHVLWLVGIAQIFVAIFVWMMQVCFSVILFNLLGITLYGLYGLVQRQRKIKMIKRRQKENELCCFAVVLFTALVMGVIRDLGLYAMVGKVACLEVLVGILLNERLRVLKYYLAYAEDAVTYIRLNRRVIYIYIKSYFIR